MLKIKTWTNRIYLEVDTFAETTEEGADGDDENQQGWGQWAWSFVPQILAEDEPDNDEVQERKKRTPSVFSLGTYAYKMSITFKVLMIGTSLFFLKLRSTNIQCSSFHQ